MSEDGRISTADVLKCYDLLTDAPKTGTDSVLVSTLNWSLLNNDKKTGRDNFLVNYESANYVPKYIERMLLKLPPPLLVFTQDCKGIFSPFTEQTNDFIYTIHTFCENRISLNINGLAYFKDLKPLLRESITSTNLVYYFIRPPYTEESLDIFHELLLIDEVQDMI